MHGIPALAIMPHCVNTYPEGLFIALSLKLLTCDNGWDKPSMNKPPGTLSHRHVSEMSRPGKGRPRLTIVIQAAEELWKNGTRPS
jgi:hypothetical protein